MSRVSCLLLLSTLILPSFLPTTVACIWDTFSTERFQQNQHAKDAWEQEAQARSGPNTTGPRATRKAGKDPYQPNQTPFPFPSGFICASKSNQHHERRTSYSSCQRQTPQANGKRQRVGVHHFDLHLLIHLFLLDFIRAAPETRLYHLSNRT